MCSRTSPRSIAAHQQAGHSALESRVHAGAQVLKRLPQLKKLDGIPVDVDERDQAKAAGGK